MTVQEAMRVIDREVVSGARITVREYSPFKVGDRSFPASWTATIGPVLIDDVPAHPACTAYSQESAIIGIGALLAGWGRADA